MQQAPLEIDLRVGIGLRAPHIDELLASLPPLGWLEIHSENWMTQHGPVAERLQQIRCAYPVSLHGVGLSLGSSDGIDPAHLNKLCALVQRSHPILISEHLSWGRLGQFHSNDLLPLPFNQAAIDVLTHNIDTVQQALGRRILVENLSSYCTFASSTMPEWEFIQQVTEKADCGLLLDLNNLYVNAHNHGFEAQDYLAGVPLERIEEIHLAGFETEGSALVDTHSRPVQQPVWQLFAQVLQHLSNTPRVLIEWDNELPSLATLLQEAHTASRAIQEHYDAAA